jgi:hypothetical protein
VVAAREHNLLTTGQREGARRSPIVITRSKAKVLKCTFGVKVTRLISGDD